MSKWSDPDRKQQLFRIQRSVLTKLKAYAQETEQTFDTLVEPEFIIFEQALIKKCEQIDEIRYKALEARKKEKEEQALADENPLPVSGHEVDRIGNLEVEPIQTS